jgi:hypothetical protein
VIEYPVPAAEISRVIFTDWTKESTEADCSSAGISCLVGRLGVKNQSCKPAGEDGQGRVFENRKSGLVSEDPQGGNRLKGRCQRHS